MAKAMNKRNTLATPSVRSDRQHQQYLAVLEKLADNPNPSAEEEKYAEVLITLIQAYEEKRYPIPTDHAVSS